MTRIRFTVVSVLVLTLSVLTAVAAHAQGTLLVALVRGTNMLITFNSTNPGTILSTIPITGLAAGEVVRAIDTRPANGLLYGLATPNMRTSQVRLYVINSATGAASAVGPAANVAIAGNFWGMSFNAVTDRVRIGNDFNDNARLHPDTGALAGQDTPFSGSGFSSLDALAYDNQFAGAAQTTLYGLNNGPSTLVRIGGPQGSPSPNLGVTTNIGALGPSLLGTSTALDFAADGTLFAAIGYQGTENGLYTINTSTGAATLIGLIGNGAQGIDGLSAANPGLIISPGPGTYSAQQRFDLVLFLNAPGRSIVGGSAMFNGINVTGFIASCATLGRTATGLTTIRCANFGGPLFGAGNHTFQVNLVLDNGVTVSAGTTWTVVASSEP